MQGDWKKALGCIRSCRSLTPALECNKKRVKTDIKCECALTFEKLKGMYFYLISSYIFNCLRSMSHQNAVLRKEGMYMYIRKREREKASVVSESERSP